MSILRPWSLWSARAFAASQHSRHLTALCFAGMITLCGGCDSEGPKGSLEGEGVDFGEGGQRCVFDQDDSYSQGRLLRLTEPEEGLICPIGDADWYQLTLDRQGIMNIELEVPDTQLSPLNLMYELYRADGDETQDLVASSFTSEASTYVKASHCVTGGAHGLRIFDLNDDGQDKRNNYAVEVNLVDDPDTGERSGEGLPEGVRIGEIPEGETPEVTARPLNSGDSAEGYIACRGDEDWYSIEVPERSILSFKLTQVSSQVQPQITLFDASIRAIVSLNNANTERAAELQRDISLTEGGRFYFLVKDSSGVRSDLENPYTLEVSAIEDTDLNEPNNRASEATALSASPLSCGDTWSEWVEVTGVIGTLGDLDWFTLDVSGCDLGLLEVELELDDSDLEPSESFALQRGLGLSVNLVESHEPTVCDPADPTADEGCRQLAQSCGGAWDCAGISLSCLPEGVCAGSTVCLPNERCAATKISRHYTLPSNATEVALPRHRVRLSAPLSGDARRYLRVGDYGGNAADPRARYTLKARLRREPDVNEPSNVYTDEVRRSDNVADHIRLARGTNVVYVHDCSEGIVAPPPPEEMETSDKEAGAEAEEAAGEAIAGEMMGGATAGEMMGGSTAGEMMGGATAGEMMGGSTAGEMMGGATAGEMMGGATAGEMMGGATAGEMMGGAPAGDMMGGMPAGEVSGEMGGAEPPEPVNGLLPTCCSSPDAVWTEGLISYEDDQDFYAYRHPCPGEDCMVKIYYEIDEGPVDLLWQVYQGNQLWFDPIVPVSELAVNAGLSGSFGGVEPGDQCFYAWQGHRGDEFYYTISIRDLRPTRDWSTEQRYRFCIEKAGQGCFEPPCVNRPQPESGAQDGGCSVRR